MIFDSIRGKKMEEKKSKLTSKFTGKSCISTTQFFIQDIYYMHLGEISALINIFSIVSCVQNSKT
jgi:hypothetical protein